MNGVKPVGQGRVDGPSGPTVTEMFDRCRYTDTASGERGRTCPCERAPACVGGRAMPPRHAAPHHVAGLRRHTRRDGDHPPIDEPDQTGRRGGLGTLVRMWQALLSRGRGMDLCDRCAT
jgi:hypothetical protein